MDEVTQDEVTKAITLLPPKENLGLVPSGRETGVEVTPEKRH